MVEKIRSNAPNDLNSITSGMLYIVVPVRVPSLTGQFVGRTSSCKGGRRRRRRSRSEQLQEGAAEQSRMRSRL